MEEPSISGPKIKHEIDVKTENITDSQDSIGEDNQRLHIVDLDTAPIDNGEVETVVLQNIQLTGEEGSNHLEIIGKIISHNSNSDGNLEINTLEEDNNVIRTYIIK